MDRLTAPDAATNAGLHPDSLEYARSLEASICRDLTALLNTRRADKDFDQSFDEAANSLLSFGVVDFTAFNLTSGVDQERVRCSIERAIRKFEPRLAGVSVSVGEAGGSKPVLHLQIEAILKSGSHREPISFSAALYRDSRRIAVSTS